MTSAGSRPPGASTGPRREIDAEAIAATHARYAAERAAAIPDDHVGPRPFGGVGGTRVGVKCLHAHVAHLLATGDDVVGRWTLDQIGRSSTSHGIEHTTAQRREPTRTPTRAG